MINKNYYEKLQDFVLSDAATDLLRLVLEDTNTSTYRFKYLYDRTVLLKQIEEQDTIISKARKLFVADRLDFDDFRGLKTEYQAVSQILQKEFNILTDKLKRLKQQTLQAKKSFENIFQGYQYMDAADKRQIISLIPPCKINALTGNMSVELNSTLTKIMYPKSQYYQK